MPFQPIEDVRSARHTKTITPTILIQILKPCQAFLELLACRCRKCPMRRSTISAWPPFLPARMSGTTPTSLRACTSSTPWGVDANFDELLDIARRNFIEVELEATACDLAARIWLVGPQILPQLKDRKQMVDRRRKYEIFRARDPGSVVPIEKLPADRGPLQLDLEGYFQSKNVDRLCCRAVPVIHDALFHAIEYDC